MVRAFLLLALFISSARAAHGTPPVLTSGQIASLTAACHVSGVGYAVADMARSGEAPSPADYGPNAAKVAASASAAEFARRQMPKASQSFSAVAKTLGVVARAMSAVWLSSCAQTVDMLNQGKRREERDRILSGEYGKEIARVQASESSFVVKRVWVAGLRYLLATSLQTSEALEVIIEMAKKEHQRRGQEGGMASAAPLVPDSVVQEARTKVMIPRNKNVNGAIVTTVERVKASEITGAQQVH